MSQTVSILLAAVAGATLGGAGVYYTLGPNAGAEVAPTPTEAVAETVDEAGEETSIVAGWRTVRGLPLKHAEVKDPEPKPKVIEDYSAREDPAVLAKDDWSTRLGERLQRDPRNADNRPRDKRGKPISEDARAFMADRSKMSTGSFLDASEETLDYFGTDLEQQARDDLAQRLRNAMYYSPEEAKPAIRRLYEATKAYQPGDPNSEFEWNEARKDVAATIDRLDMALEW